MHVNGVEVEETFAEAFPMWMARAVVTAESLRWAMTAAQVMVGNATSVIGCGCEAGVERVEGSTPDGRPGVSVLMFAVSREALTRELVGRIGQAVMTAPTTACYNGLESTESVRVGGVLRFFGDGFQRSKRLESRRFWRIPVMDGEYVVDDRFGVAQGIGGGNFLVLGETQAAALAAAVQAARAARSVPGVILPFPGGIARSGSKPSSRYRFLRASTNDAYCPTLRTRTATRLPEGVNAVYEIIIDGVDEAAVREAMGRGIRAACRSGIARISASNFEGRLGTFHFYLHAVLAA
jgi:formylmethanofuran--tetrahydromethanopterin N-formyltransferase